LGGVLLHIGEHVLHIVGVHPPSEGVLVEYAGDGELIDTCRLTIVTKDVRGVEGMEGI
jgi:hypothetical protein